MKYFITLLVFFTLAFQVKSQNKIVGYEYWFNNDFANRVSTNVAPSSELNLNSNISTTGINAGIHCINFRSWDDSSRYSSIVSSFFYKIVPSTAPNNRNIVAYEYWFDNDYTNKVSQTVSSQHSLDLNAIITTGTINAGVHTFNIRFKDDSKLWSSVSSQFFYKITPSTAPNNRNIVAYEYWFDNNYANKVSQTVSSQHSLDLNAIITTGTINAGVHTFNIRFKDDSKLWSSILSHFFYKLNEQVNLTSNKITTYRYWFDNNFAQVNTVSLTTPVKQLNLIDDLNLTQISKGIHTIHFQFKDSVNVWSSVTSDSITKLALPIADFSFNSTANCDSTTISFIDNSIDGDVYLWNFGDGNTSNAVSPAHTYYSTGVYNVSLTVSDTATGLDSTYIVPVNIKMKTSSTIQQTACGSFVSPSGNYVWTASNTYIDTILNANNCDSIITVNLTILNLATSIDTRTTCDSLVWIDGNTYYANNNVATYTIFGGAANSCDSIITLDLQIIGPSTSTDTRTACDSLVWIDGNTYYSNNNTAKFTIFGGAESSCDSIITLDLTINTVDVSVTITDPSITANTSGAVYQWLDCNNNYAVITGENAQTFTATNNGNYAVEITQNNCTNISVCTTIKSIGIIENNFENDILLYPNPTNGNFSIDLGTNFESINIQIKDLTGKIVQSNSFKSGQIFKLSINETSGVYFVNISAGNKKAVIKIVKE